MICREKIIFIIDKVVEPCIEIRIITGIWLLVEHLLRFHYILPEVKALSEKLSGKLLRSSGMY